MTRTFRLTRRAEIELYEAIVWYENAQEGLGLAFETAVYATMIRVCERPEAFRRVGSHGRRALTRGFPHGLYYTIDSSEIIVLAVFHLGRDPEHLIDLDL